MSDTLDTDLAAELLGTAMRDSEAPVMEMAGALARINSVLRQAQAQAPCDCSELTQDIAICIQGLQFHDRLMQQLTAVRKLMGTTPMTGDLANAFLPREGTVELF